MEIHDGCQSFAYFTSTYTLNRQYYLKTASNEHYVHENVIQVSINYFWNGIMGESQYTMAYI